MKTSASTIPIHDLHRPPTLGSRPHARDWVVIALLGLGHMFVDATSILAANVVASASGDGTSSDVARAAAIIATYNLMAFAPQIVLGLFVDMFPARFAGLFAALGAAMVTIAALAATQSAELVLALAGAGNALYHVGAGGICLRLSRGRAAPGGVFVAPGGLGVVLGTYAGWGVWPIRGALIAGCGIVALVAAVIQRWAHLNNASDDDTCREPQHGFSRTGLVLLLLLFAVASRQIVGGYIGKPWPAVPAAWIAVACVATAGKALFGFVADRFGWMIIAVGMALLAAPLAAWRTGSLPVDMAATFLLQAAMPVTLALTFRLLPRYPATAFGLTGASIWLSVLPASFAWPIALGTTQLIAACAVAAAIYLTPGSRK